MQVESLHQIVVDDLRRRDQMVQFNSIALIVIAIPLMFIGPLLLATVFWFATAQLYAYFPWTWFFLGLCVVMIPAMLAGEARQRGGYFAGANLDTINEGLASGTPSPYAMAAFNDVGALVAFAANPRAVASGFVEIFLVGPRLLLDGLTMRRRAKQVADVSRERAAVAVMQLAAFDQGVSTKSLLKHEVPGQLTRVLCLLVFHEWIGVSKTGDRVWLSTDARNRLS
jgi:hypothetical protein